MSYHGILCNKLQAMGVHSDSEKWFKSYLSDRQQIVSVNQVESKPMNISCGVPQGSILGPLLFLCYVNDMASSVNCKLLLYADDSALFISGKDPKVIPESLCKERESCRQWLIDIEVFFLEQKSDLAGQTNLKSLVMVKLFIQLTLSSTLG